MKWNVHSCPLIPYILNVQAARKADCTEILFNNVFRRTISNYEWASLLLLAVTQSLRCYVNKYILFMYGNAHVTFFFFFFFLFCLSLLWLPSKCSCLTCTLLENLWFIAHHVWYMTKKLGIAENPAHHQRNFQTRWMIFISWLNCRTANE